MAGNKNSGNRGTPKNKTSKDKEKQILSVLKKGKGLVETAALTGVSRNAVQRIRYENADNLPVWRKNTIENLTRVHDKLLHNIEENIDKIPAAAKTISLGIISDKINQHSGFSAQVVEHKHLHIDHSAVNGLLSDNKSDGEASKQRETEQAGTIQDIKSPAIDVEPVNQKESPGQQTKRGGGGRAKRGGLDT
jgi:hypothetical protein